MLMHTNLSVLATIDIYLTGIDDEYEPFMKVGMLQIQTL
jgi:hypothetical protein